MARFLFATQPAAGHTLPALPIARVLVARGHSVRWYTGAGFADQIAAVGATFHPISDPSWDHSIVGLDGRYPQRTALSGLRKLQFDLVNGFAKPVVSQVRDLRALLDTEGADAVIGDTAFIGAPILQELGGPPFAAFGISVLGFPHPDLAPFGTGIAPAKGRLGRLRNAALERFARAAIYRPMTAEVNRARRTLGLPETRDTVFEYALASRLYLQFSAPGFEYSVAGLPSQVRFVGPPRPVSADDWAPPAWWDELTGGRRVVLVNQGTVATEPDQLLRPALTALAGEDVLVVAVTGGADPARLGPLPANARVERFIPFDRLLSHVDVFVTNGGYGGVQLALAHGVPIVGAGKSEDKIEVNARVAHCGVGLDLRTQTPTPQRIREAVQRVLGDARFATRARGLQLEIERAGREERAATLLEEIAGVESTNSVDAVPPVAAARPAPLVESVSEVEARPALPSL